MKHTTPELESLETVAWAATPGPWQNGIEDLEGVVAPDNPGLGNVVCLPPLKCMYSSLDAWPQNAAHIATFDPPTVLGLISDLKSLREDLTQAEGERDRFMGLYDAARGDVVTLEMDVARLKSARSAAQVAEPVGEWVLVPRKPTQEMIEAYCRKAHDLGFTSWVNLSALWPGVLAAAPRQPQIQERDDGAE